MAKRSATSDINHDNWNQPLEAEEAGTFKPASENDMQNRVIKTAKRRLKPSGNTGTETSVFASFGGFKGPATNVVNTNKAFGFLATASSNSTGNNSLTPPIKFAVGSQPTKNDAVGRSPTSESKVNPQQCKMQSEAQEKYLSQLKELNSSVLDWLKTHVEANPYCILTPVFNDYDKHLKQIQEKRDTNESSTPAPSAPTSLSSFNSVSSSSSVNKFTIDVPSDTSTGSSSSEKSNPSLFGMTKDSGKSPLLQGDATKAPTTSLFGSIKSSSTSSSFFTKPDPASLMVNPFTSVTKKDENTQEKPFSFSNGSKAMSSSKTNEEEEDSEEPPKVEFTPVEEEGSVFSIRCKVFVKKEDNYKERGVGTLYIKKVGENKHQLLVRAETALGNVVLNILLSSAVPTERKGANNVMLVCVPTPQDPPPPTVVLLRVKTAQQADQLLETIQKYQN